MSRPQDKAEQAKKMEKKCSQLCFSMICGLDVRCIFQPAFGCYALQTLVDIVIFSVFCVKKFFGNKIVDLCFGANAGGNIQQTCRNN